MTSYNLRFCSEAREGREPSGGENFSAATTPPLFVIWQGLFLRESPLGNGGWELPPTEEGGQL